MEKKDEKQYAVVADHVSKIYELRNKDNQHKSANKRFYALRMCRFKSKKAMSWEFWERTDPENQRCRCCCPEFRTSTPGNHGPWRAGFDRHQHGIEHAADRVGKHQSQRRFDGIEKKGNTKPSPRM